MERGKHECRTSHHRVSDEIESMTFIIETAENGIIVLF